MQPTDALYLQHRQLIRIAVFCHLRKCGGDFDDLECMANEFWLDAVIAFDDAKRKGIDLETWVAVRIRQRLINHFATQRRHQNVLQTSDRLDEEGQSSSFFLNLWDELSEDARSIVEVIFDCPIEVIRDAQKKGGHARNFRWALREYMRGLDWSKRRIDAAYKSIKGALER